MFNHIAIQLTCKLRHVSYNIKVTIIMLCNFDDENFAKECIENIENACYFGSEQQQNVWISV